MVRHSRPININGETAEASALGACRSWCGRAEPPCWVHDLDEAWGVTHARAFGHGVSVVQTGMWTPRTGLVMSPAVCSLGTGRSDDWLLGVADAQLVIDAMVEAIALVGHINEAPAGRGRRGHRA